MTFKLGDYVQVTNHGQLGRIYQKDRVYAGSPSFLKVQLENENCVEMDKYQPWVHILVHGSGCMYCAIGRVKLVPRFDFTNDNADFYFGGEV